MAAVASRSYSTAVIVLNFTLTSDGSGDFNLYVALRLYSVCMTVYVITGRNFSIINKIFELTLQEIPHNTFNDLVICITRDLT